MTIYNVPETKDLVMYITTAGPIDFGKAIGEGSPYKENIKAKEWHDLMAQDFHSGWTSCTEIH